jgi:hypothetical protein
MIALKNRASILGDPSLFSLPSQIPLCHFQIVISQCKDASKKIPEIRYHDFDGLVSDLEGALESSNAFQVHYLSFVLLRSFPAYCQLYVFSCECCQSVEHSTVVTAW